MNINGVLKKTRSRLVWLVLPAAIITLLAELTPEYEAKIIVIPTLVIMIVLCILEIRESRI